MPDYVPYLPKLKDGTENKLQPPHEVGGWDHISAETRLHALAHAIDVQPGAAQILSIPDPWARVILFSRALFDPKHSLHARVLGEWRGLLAILGLKEIRKFSELTAASVDLDTGERTPTRFLSTVGRVKPSAAEAFVEDAAWDRFHIFRWYGKECGGAHRAFGMTSWATLVATGADYKDVFSRDEVPWFVGGHLVDPVTPLPGEDVAPGNLSKSDRQGLAEWVLYVKSRLQSVGENTRHGELLEYLNQYAEDLDDKAKLLKGTDFLSDNNIGVHVPELFDCLDRPRKPAAQVLTDLEIIPDREQKHKYVLYDADLVRHLKKKEHDVTVYNTITLASATRDISGLETKKTGLLGTEKDSEIWWCTEGFFFQDDLIYEKPDSERAVTFPGCRKINATGRSENRQAAWPLTKEAAELFSADYLAANFSIEWLTSGGARCKLKLRVKTVINKPAADAKPEPVREVQIEHVYEEKDMVRIHTLPLVCVWPNFRFPDEPVAPAPQSEDGAAPASDNRWKRYYIFETWAGMEKELEVKPLDETGMEKRPYQQSDHFFQVIQTSRFPDVLVCEMPANQERGDLRPRPARGLLLLAEAEKPIANRGLRVALGVDFGTTGTSIYRAQLEGTGSDESTSHLRQMAFKDRVIQVTGGSQDIVKDQTRHSFIPARITALGRMLSVYQAHHGGGGRVEVLDGHVLFQDSSENGTVFVWGANELVRTNLKWGTEQLQMDAARAFLSQLCIQSVAELVADGASEVDVRYSYPTAFSGSDLRRLHGIWTGVLDDLQKATSVRINPNDWNEDNYEAVAAARYFATSGDMNITSGAVTLDIGGGTTDIAVWNESEGDPSLIAHSSVLFAGTNMLQSVVYDHEVLLTKIYDKFPIPNMKRAEHPDAYVAEMDALISTHGEKLLQRLPEASHVSEEVREFISILELGMCGIGFYSGLLLGHLIQTGKYDPTPSLIQVFVGGNASRLLHWCDMGEFREGTPFYKKFTRCVLAGGQLGAPELIQGKSVEVTISKRPKQEVAFGLVAKYIDTKRLTDHSNPLAGENYRVGGGEIQPWNTAPAVEDLLNKSLDVDRDLPVFSLFLSVANEEIGEAEKQKIVGAIKESITAMKQKAQRQASDPKLAKEMKGGDKLNPVRKEPLFIIALKKLIDMRINGLVKGV